jgi:uncharacterized protein (UPF0332 family)
MTQETRRLLDKAGRALRASETLLRAGDPESAAGRAYYAMLHTAQALLRHKDLRYRKHGGVHAAFGEHFAKSGVLDPKYHRWLLDAFDARLRGDYDINAVFDEESVAATLQQAREFLETTRRFLEKSE